MPEVAETLLALLRSPNENTRLNACREICDRVLGRAAIAIDATHTRLDVAQLYLRAMQRANSHIASEQAVEGKANEIDAGNGGANATSE